MNKHQTHPITAYTFRDSFELGTRTAFSIFDDPIHISFVLSRYKFCSRMLTGIGDVLEIGCGDAVGTPIVAQFVTRVHAIDVEDRVIKSNKVRLEKINNISFETLDYCQKMANGTFAAVFSIDVLEHIPKKKERIFMDHIVNNLSPDGVCIIGTPNITAYRYASVSSRGHHINLKSHESLKNLLQTYFTNVFMFSMNDEVIHTGFGNMAHYLFGMGVGVKMKGNLHAKRC